MKNNNSQNAAQAKYPVKRIITSEGDPSLGEKERKRRKRQKGLREKHLIHISTELPKFNALTE